MAQVFETVTVIEDESRVRALRQQHRRRFEIMLIDRDMYDLFTDHSLNKWWPETFGVHSASK